MAKILVDSELLEEIKEYMDNKADVDWEDEKQKPNQEAKLSVLLFDLLHPKSKVKPQPAPPVEQKEVASDTDVLKRTRGLIKEVKRLPSYGEMWNLQSAVEQLESVLPG